MENKLELNVPNNFYVQGAKLTTLTQSIAYKGILERKRTLLRPSSSNNIQQMREGIKRITGSEENDATIWLSTRKSPIHPKIRQFLFKTMHEVFKISEFWNHIPDVAERSQCVTCGTTEMMGHILTHCRSSLNRTIWDLATTTWPHQDLPWPGNDLGTILGCRCLTAQHAINQNQNQNQNTRTLTFEGPHVFSRYSYQNWPF